MTTESQILEVNRLKLKAEKYNEIQEQIQKRCSELIKINNEKLENYWNGTTHYVNLLVPVDIDENDNILFSVINYSN